MVMAHGFDLNILLLNNPSFIPKYTKSPKVHQLLYLQVVVFSLLHPLFAATTKLLLKLLSKSDEFLHLLHIWKRENHKEAITLSERM